MLGINPKVIFDCFTANDSVALEGQSEWSDRIFPPPISMHCQVLVMRDLALFHREEAGSSLNHSGFPAAIGAVNNDNVTAVDFQIK